VATVLIAVPKILPMIGIFVKACTIEIIIIETINALIRIENK
jgi:hypothetical protein